MAFRWTDDLNDRLLELVAQMPVRNARAWAEAGEVLGTSGNACSIQWARLKQRIVKDRIGAPPADKMQENESYTSPLGTTPLTEAQAIELFQVDLTKWEPVKLTHNVWMQGSTGPDGELLHQNLYQTTLHLKRIAGSGLVELTESLLQSLRDAAPCGPFVVTRTKAQHMLELDAFDLHLGKLAWSLETGGSDYDLGIAAKDFREALDDSLTKASGFQLSKALLPLGNDLLQTDNLRSETTAGTRVDSDSRYHKMFDAAVKEMRWAVERLKERAPLVEVVVVPGNHDRLGAFTVGRVLEAVYESDPRVTFQNSPNLRKYVQFGVTLLGFTHGNEEKHNDLPLIMAHEQKQAWADTLFHEWHVGHNHKYKKTRYVAGDSFQGTVIRIIRSLSEADAWHSQKGYIGGRRAIETFVYHLKEGEVGAFISRHQSQ